MSAKTGMITTGGGAITTGGLITTGGVATTVAGPTVGGGTVDGGTVAGDTNSRVLTSVRGVPYDPPRSRRSRVRPQRRDRKSTRLNSSHANTSYAAFCLKQKT